MALRNCMGWTTTSTIINDLMVKSQDRQASCSSVVLCRWVVWGQPSIYKSSYSLGMEGIVPGMLEARSSVSTFHPSNQVHIYHIQGMVGISVHLSEG